MSGIGFGGGFHQAQSNSGGGGTVTGAENGLNVVANKVRLGGSLIVNTTVDLSSFSFDLEYLSGKLAQFSTTRIALGMQSILPVDDKSVIFGNQINPLAFTNVIAIGSLATPKISDSIAIGDRSQGVSGAGMSIGYLAGFRATAVGVNTSLIGVSAGQDSLLLGTDGVFIGSGSGGFSTTAGNNIVGIGNSSFKASTVGNDSIAIGNEAGSVATVGNSVVLLGARIGVGSTFNDNAIVIGKQAASINPVTIGANSVIIGYQANSLIDSGSNATSVGPFSQAGDFGAAFGYYANALGTEVTAIGIQAGYLSTMGTYSVTLGARANQNITVGLNAVGIGYDSKSRGSASLALLAGAETNEAQEIAIGQNANTGAVAKGLAGITIGANSNVGVLTGAYHVTLGTEHKNASGAGIAIGHLVDNATSTVNQIGIGELINNDGNRAITLGSGTGVGFELQNTVVDSFAIGWQSTVPSIQLSKANNNYFDVSGNFAFGNLTPTKRYQFFQGSTELLGITSGGQQTSDATFTATGNNSYQYGYFGTHTARNTASDTLFGYQLRNTLVAAANNQTLVASRRRPSFNIGAFTGITRVIDYIENGGGGINFYQAIESPSNFARFGFGNQTLGSVSATVEVVGEGNSSSTISLAAWTNGKGLRNWAVRDDGPMVLRNIGATRTAADGIVQYTGTDLLLGTASANYSLLGYSTHDFYINSTLVNGSLGYPVASNNPAIAVDVNEWVTDVSIDFETLAAAAAGSITIDVRELTTSSAGVGTPITSAVGTSRVASTYSTGGASATTYHRTLTNNNNAATITQGNAIFVACTGVSFITATNVNVKVRTRRRI